MKRKILSIVLITSLVSALCTGCGLFDNRNLKSADNGTGFEIDMGGGAPQANSNSASKGMGFAADSVAVAESADYDGAYYEEDMLITNEYYEEVPFDTEEYNSVHENSFMDVSVNPLSTFAADVDTGSYCNFRNMVLTGYHSLNSIPPGSIRTEEFINYFKYELNNKSTGTFSVDYQIDTCPWNPESDLLVMSVQANDASGHYEGNNIVLLVDTSGSMNDIDKLDLVKDSIDVLTDNLDDNDRVSLVTYAGDARVIFEGYRGKDKRKIMNEVKKLNADGCTNGGGGIEAAYESAKKNFIKGGNNRVIIFSDGDMNLGITSQSGLVDLISEKKESGVFLTVLGYGRGNYSDANMESIADAGNGNYYYIDCIEEAEKVLAEDLLQTTVTVAKDVKFQAEFNPAKVASYRQVGYENRQLAARDFEDDTKDGGEVGAGQQVTVLYELIYNDGTNKGKKLKYQNNDDSSYSDSDELLTMSIRYKEPDGKTSTLEEYPIEKDGGRLSQKDWGFCAGLAELTMVLHNSEYLNGIDLDYAYSTLSDNAGKDKYRTQLLDILEELGATYVDTSSQIQPRERIDDDDDDIIDKSSEEWTILIDFDMDGYDSADKATFISDITDIADRFDINFSGLKKGSTLGTFVISDTSFETKDEVRKYMNSFLREIAKSYYFGEIVSIE